MVDRQKSRRLIGKRADGRSQQEPMVDPNSLPHLRRQRPVLLPFLTLEPSSTTLAVESTGATSRAIVLCQSRSRRTPSHSTAATPSTPATPEPPAANSSRAGVTPHPPPSAPAAAPPVSPLLVQCRRRRSPERAVAPGRRHRARAARRQSKRWPAAPCGPVRPGLPLACFASSSAAQPARDSAHGQ
jgi:hypothetical protein